MLESTTASELAELKALERIDGPGGQRRDDWRIAAMTAALVNAMPLRGSGAEPIRAEDLLLRFAGTLTDEPEEAPQTQGDRQQQQAALVWAKLKAAINRATAHNRTK